jgi:hypoxanthine phosphoribosyltransferase
MLATAITTHNILRFPLKMTSKHKLKPLFSREHIQKKIAETAKKISDDYRDKKPVMIAILKGSFVFLADIIRDLNIDVTIEFVQISSYGSSKTSSGTCVIHKDVTTDIKGRDVIIIEDIVDSGNTLDFFIKNLEKQNPASIKTCALINKTVRREHNLVINYYAFDINEEFIVGYGLDYDEQFRNLSGIYELLD